VSETNSKNDVSVVGGGLAGLISAIQLAREGWSVSLFEKKQYPFHRVCGEYISNETLPFLQANGLFPSEFHPEKITRFQLTSVNGKSRNYPSTWGDLASVAIPSTTSCTKKPSKRV
jgi:menaquinone-9 beta-reductase